MEEDLLEFGFREICQMRTLVGHIVNIFQAKSVPPQQKISTTLKKFAIILFFRAQNDDTLSSAKTQKLRKVDSSQRTNVPCKLWLGRRHFWAVS